MPTSQRKWDMTMPVPKDFMRYGVKMSELLVFTAEHVKAVINARVDKGIGADDRPLTPYAESFHLARGEDGQILRDEKGHWTEQRVPGPGRVVDMRSVESMPDPLMHMREHMEWSPKFPVDTDRRVWLSHQGSRMREKSGPGGKTVDVIRHSQRAAWCQRGGTWEKPDRTVPQRYWFGISPTDRMEYLSAMRKTGVAGWLEKHRADAVPYHMRKAIAARKNMMRAILAQDKVREESARRRAAKYIKQLGPAWDGTRDPDINKLKPLKPKKPAQQYKRRSSTTPVFKP